MSSRLVVDASVAVKWVLAEADSEQALGVVSHTLIAPDLLLLECGSALWKHVQLGEIGAESVPPALATIRAMPMRLMRMDDLVERAAELALLLKHPIYGCVYLALALEQGAHLVTSDSRFLHRLRQHAALAGAAIGLRELAH